MAALPSSGGALPEELYAKLSRDRKVSERVVAERREMLQDPCVLDEAGRAVVLATIQGYCTHRGWNLLAAHVRSNHVHAVVAAETRPERIMNEFQGVRQPCA